MAKSEKRKRKKMTLPLAVLLPVAAPIVDGVMKMNGPGGVRNGVDSMTAKFTGLQSDGTFNSAYLVNTYAPIAVGALIHWGAGRFGVNRALGNAKVPVIRL